MVVILSHESYVNWPEEGVCNAGEDLSALIAHFCPPCENPCDWLQVTLADLLVDLQTRKFNYSISLSSYHIQLCYSMDYWFWRPLWAAKSPLSLQWQKSQPLSILPEDGWCLSSVLFSTAMVLMSDALEAPVNWNTLSVHLPPSRFWLRRMCVSCYKILSHCWSPVTLSWQSRHASNKYMAMNWW